ncbi:hypothetical protein [Pseudodesulfovibrio profundus]|uniref:hypothetical protein n=1 Tax=Pseudodesulfovibrio profundus TaxID=57320 RepID=UPI000BE2BAF0|nr:hypothetical protein [Pseudodesulfovibrio profundus]
MGIFELIKRKFSDDRRCRLCTTCGFIHHSQGQACFICESNTIKTNINRAKRWRREMGMREV